MQGWRIRPKGATHCGEGIGKSGVGLCIPSGLAKRQGLRMQVMGKEDDQAK